MLIWIRAPSAAIGILTLFVLLMGTVVPEATPNRTQDAAASALPSPDADEWSAVRLDQLPFADNILRPCPRAAPVASIKAEHLREFKRNVYNQLSHYAALYRNEAQRFLDEDDPYNCAHQNINDLPNTPTVVELTNMTKEEAINSIYSSLLFHSMYSYFIHHQFGSAIKCSDDDNVERTRAENFLILGNKEKTLACFVRTSAYLLDYRVYEDGNLSDESLSDLRLCSRRALRDCQVLRSTIRLLSAVSEYASQN